MHAKVYQITKHRVDEDNFLNENTLEQEIFDIDTQEVKSRCLSILVLYDLEQKQSIPFSDEWRQAIRDYDGIL